MKLIFPKTLVSAFTVIITTIFVSSLLLVPASGVTNREQNQIAVPPPVQEGPPRPAFEGKMTLERINTIVMRLDKQAKQPRKGVWEFTIEEIPVVIVTDKKYNRMRILVGIRKALTLTRAELMRISQANFDSALDARYAIAKGVLWAAYIHPLHALFDKQFISAIGQTINIAKEYGRSYSSGALLYGGGDSGAIFQQQLIRKLQKKGLEI